MIRKNAIGFVFGTCAALLLALCLASGCAHSDFDFGENTFVAQLADGSEVTSRSRGVKPLLDAIDDDPAKFVGAKCYDRVVGRAAAFLYAKLGVAEVYAPVMAEGAVPILERHGIRARHGKLVSGIRNRKDDGPCPMEHSVRNVADTDVDVAVAAVRAVVATLRAQASKEDKRGSIR